MTFPRNEVVARLEEVVDTLLSTGGRAARGLFLSEIYSPGDSGNASPFLKSLFPEIKLAATLERSLITSLGRAMDHVVADVARAAHGAAETNYTVTGTVPAATSAQIEGIVGAYTTGVGHGYPNTESELGQILPGVASPGAKEDVSFADDVFFVGKDGLENHIEIKTAKPNYDQARASKRRILRCHAVRHPESVRAFVGMPYNPNGRFGNYEWPVTPYFLDPKADLKVGRGFWNYVGDSETAYEELLECFSAVSRARGDELRDLLREVR